jgi:hypothetical protein
MFFLRRVYNFQDTTILPARQISFLPHSTDRLF